MQRDDDLDPELIEPEDFLPVSPIPTDARRLGFDRNSEGGAMILLAASLDPAKLSHRLMAWLMLVAFVAPTILGLLLQIF